MDLSISRSISMYSLTWTGPVPPAGVRCVSRERYLVDQYLRTLGTLDLFEDIAAGHPPMEAGTRAVILLPARFEENRIERFFDALTEDLQGAVPPGDCTVEVLILNNWHQGETPDQTGELIRQQAQKTNLPYRLLYLERAWQPEEAETALARSRKLLADYTLYRAAQRTSWDGPLYLFSEDADVEAIEPGRTCNMIRYMDAHPRLDALRGVQMRTPSALARNHLLLFERRSWYFTETQLARQRYWPVHNDRANFYWHRVVTGGWNTCFSASIYALIRGYTPEVRIFEDMDIGQRISVVRGAWRGKRFVPDVSTVRRVRFRATSSAARALLALIQKRHIYDDRDNYSFFFDKAHETQVRQANLDELLETLAPETTLNDRTVHRFETLCEDLLEETRRIFGDRNEAQRVFSRTLWLMGLHRRDIRTSPEGRIKFLNYSPFLTSARAFHNRVVQSGPLCV